MKVCPTCNTEWPDETKFCPNDGTTLRSASGTGSLVGSVVADRYHIVKKLGEGGMGAVYLGEHVKMGRKSAIKVMTQAMAHDPDAIARFNREAANAARINHPSVCAIYDFGETPDGLIYLAMEFIEGEALTALIEREGALAPRRAALILEQTGDALQAAHDLGIVHRDLKPDNIMIARGRDGTDVVKVVDFGIAKAVGGEEGQNVTKTGLVVGTPEYMSPEQLSGDKLDGRSDIYSLALVFFRMLTGTLPFQADSAQETMIKRLTDDPMRLAEAMPNATFPPQLQEIMDRALARMPPERYASAAAFAKDVVRTVSGMAASAPAVTADGATMLMDSAATAGIAKTRVASAGGPPTRTPDTPTPRVAPPAPAAPKKKTPTLAIAAGVVAVVSVGATAVVMFGGGGNGSGGPDTSQVVVPPANVTPDTARTRGTSNTGTTGRREEGTRRGGADAGRQSPGDGPRAGRANLDVPPAVPTGTATPQPAVDSAAIFTELGTLIDDAFDPATSARARRRAQQHYDNPDVPTALRAQAAFIIAQSFFVERRAQDACEWNGRALSLAPTNTQYLRFRTDQSCQ